MQQKTRPVNPSTLLTHAVFITTMQAIYDTLSRDIQACRDELSQGTVSITEVSQVVKDAFLATTPPPHTPLPIEALYQRLGRIEALLLTHHEKLATLEHSLEIMKATPHQWMSTPIQKGVENPTPERHITTSPERQNNVTSSTNDVTPTPSSKASVGQRHNVKSDVPTPKNTPLSKQVYSYKKSHPDATIQDIATHFGVSKSTIDRAIHKGKG
jgi:hypothetical protein